jgi:SAM-dependent methyltransferase
MTINEDKLQEFLGKIVADIGAAGSAVLVLIGDKLGIYRAMADGGPLTPGGLASRTGLSERYLREWLNAQAAGGYVTYEPTQGTFALPPEQAEALAAPDSPAFVMGLFQVTAAMWAGEAKMAANFRTGGGLEWAHQHPCLFEGIERLFRAAYIGNLISSWIPALDGVEEKLRRGAKVADIGCGLGASTILMAKAFPQSRFYGFDYHAESIAIARRRAAAQGVGGNVTFDVALSTDFPGSEYDMITHFDCLHDMEDPEGAAKHARRAIAPDGTWLIVEPFANDRPEENHNPIGRIMYTSSTMLCVPHSLAHNGPALGAQAGEARLRQIVTGNDRFKTLRRATQTPFNLVLEARP